MGGVSKIFDGGSNCIAILVFLLIVLTCSSGTC